jgi:SecD/SecF fusion protein
MLGYYLLSGVVANIALALNIVMILGVLCWFDATLTLPGIAGIVLTIGMAVDANVLIFERIREELNVGKSLKGAITSGYEKAFGTIFDANITTLIASVILIYMGKGPVKGFGVTLTIGILTSMFTALVVTRVVLDILSNRGIIGSDSSKRMMHLRPKTNLPTFDFLKYATPAFATSWLLIVVGFGYGLTKGKDTMLGVDFAGGYSMNMGSLVVEKLPDGQEKKVIGSIKPDQVSVLEESISTGEIRDKISLKSKVQANQIQAQLLADKSSDARVLQIDFPLGRGSEDAENVEEALIELFPEADLQVLKLDKVGPSVSGEIQKSALIAVMLALFGILVYVAFRYEYSFAVGAVIAILHDVAMTGGWFFLSGRELNAPIVAAALTIIGFSINDTIVIFDRIRENLRMGSRGSFADVMNKSLNQTLSRTVITSGTTLLSTATLYFFGGTIINDFAFTFLVGVIVGTYSSIYIACFIVLKWHKGKRPELAAPTVDEDPVVVMS